MSSWELPSRQTAYDVHLERDNLPWYLRVLTTTSSWLVLAGYIVFARAFTSQIDDGHASSTTLTSFGATLLIVGYLLLFFAALVVKNPLFRFDAIYLPALTSSALGLFTVLLNLTIHAGLPLQSALTYLPLTFAAISTVISASLALWTYRTLLLIKASDNRRRSHRRRRDSSWPTPTGDDTSTADLLTHDYQLPSDELQRQQLLRLLLKREGDRAPSPEALSSTYRIDIPLAQSTSTSPSEHPPNTSRFLSLPASGRGRNTTPSNERTSWQLQNLRNLLPGRPATHQEPVDVAADVIERPKSPREQRRVEIENASIARIQQFAPPGGWPAPTNPTLITTPPPNPSSLVPSLERWDDGAARYA